MAGGCGQIRRGGGDEGLCATMTTRKRGLRPGTLGGLASRKSVGRDWKYLCKFDFELGNCASKEGVRCVSAQGRDMDTLSLTRQPYPTQFD